MVELVTVELVTVDVSVTDRLASWEFSRNFWRRLGGELIIARLIVYQILYAGKLLITGFVDTRTIFGSLTRFSVFLINS